MKIIKKQGQSILEYSVLLMIVIAVLLSMGNYVKRGVQGRWKASVDEMGDQYHPTNASGTITHTISGRTHTEVNAVDQGGGIIKTDRTDTADTTDTRVGSITVPAS